MKVLTVFSPCRWRRCRHRLQQRRRRACAHHAAAARVRAVHQRAPGHAHHHGALHRSGGVLAADVRERAVPRPRSGQLPGHAGRQPVVPRVHVHSRTRRWRATPPCWPTSRRTFEAGKYYTVIFTGFSRPGATPASQVRILEDAVPTPGTSIAIRAIHAGAGIGNVDIYLTPTSSSRSRGRRRFPGSPTGRRRPTPRCAPGAFAARVTAAGSTTPLISATAPAGVAGTTAADPIAGATIPGSVITAVAFNASVAGSSAANASSPTVVFFNDRQPPRTTTP